MSDVPKTDLQRFIELHESFGLSPRIEQPDEHCEHICVTIIGADLYDRVTNIADGNPGYGVTYYFKPDGSFVSLWTGYV